MPEIIIGIIVSIAISAISSALFGKTSTPLAGFDIEPRDNQEVSRRASDIRTLVLGEARIAGPLLLFSVSGTDNEFLHMVIPHAHHPCDAVSEWFVNDESQVDETVVADTITTGRFADHVRLVAHLGAFDQAAASNLVSEVGEWTSAHKGGGVTYT